MKQPNFNDMKKVKIEFYLEECEKSEFERLSNVEETYLCNGVIFDVENDNVVAFPVYACPTDEPEKYFKVMRRIKNV